jgi:hypothetical protein
MGQFTDKEYRLIYTAVRRYQMEKTHLSSTDYQEYSIILDKLFPLTYTQRQEQPT